MRPGAIWNWAGAAVMVTVMVLHVVSLATPYYSTADFSKMNVKDTKLPLDDDAVEILTAMTISNLTMHFGFWEMCSKSSEIPDGKCVFWNVDEPKLEPGIWLTAARNLACVGAGVLLKSAIGIFLNLIVVSRGDRQRYLPFIICAFCCGGGFLGFVGNMIFAANYKSIVDDLPTQNILSPAGIDLYRDQLSLGWGFGIDLFSAFLACIAGAFHVLARYCMDKSESDMHGSRLI